MTPMHVRTLSSPLVFSEKQRWLFGCPQEGWPEMCGRMRPLLAFQLPPSDPRRAKVRQRILSFPVSAAVRVAQPRSSLYHGRTSISAWSSLIREPGRCERHGMRRRVWKCCERR